MKTYAEIALTGTTPPGITSMRQGGDAGGTLVVWLVTACLLSGCASSGTRTAGSALRQGNWAEAVRLLSARTTAEPTDAYAFAQLGEAQYRLGRYDDAEQSLSVALQLKPQLYTAHLYVGYIAEARGRLETAIAQYQVFVDRKPRSRQTRDVARRIETLRQQSARRFVRETIANEQALLPSSYPDSTIGVVYFRADHLPDSLRPLSKGLATMTVTDLSKVRALRVVERLNVDMLLDELQLSRSTAFDTSSAPRIGKLLGASRVLGGDVSMLSTDRLTITPAVVSAKTGEVVLPTDQTGALADFYRLQKQLVFDVVERLGILLSDTERDSIGRVPTQSLAAFLAYSRGLELQDSGRYDDARREFKRAAGIDPDFVEARTLAQHMSYLGHANLEHPSTLEAFAVATMHPTEWSAVAGAGTDHRLEAMLNTIGLVRSATEPSTSSDAPPYTAPAEGERSAEVIIHGRFD